MNNRSEQVHLFVFLGLISKNLITREDIVRKNNYLIVGGNSFIRLNKLWIEEFLYSKK